MPTASDITEVILWTALPNGYTDGGDLALSVFVSPQLSAVISGGGKPNLTLFPDFVNWPGTLRGSFDVDISFDVVFGHAGGGTSAPVAASFAAGSTTLDGAAWESVFSPTATGVTPYQYKDMSTLPLKSFSAGTIASNVQDLYGQLGALSPTAPVPLTLIRDTFTAPSDVSLENGTSLATLYEQIFTLITPAKGAEPGAFQMAVAAARAMHTAPEPDPEFEPTMPTVDFHQALATLGSYPAVLRMFGLVFDIVVPAPELTNVAWTTVQVLPTWQSNFTGGATGTKTDVSPLTNIVLTSDVFRSLARSSTLTYENGMLDLTDPRFSVTDLDVDLAADRLMALANALQSAASFQEPDIADRTGSKAALTVPALRSNGPAVIWSGWGTSTGDLVGLLTNQTALSDVLTNYLSDPSGPLPSLYTEDITRGHRLDVYTASDSSPSWLSLHGRAGQYTLGASSASPITFTVVDEGYAVPGGTQAAGTKHAPPPDLLVHESFIRWSGWGLSVPHPGDPLGITTIQAPAGTNPSPVPVAGQNAIPQLSANMQPINVVQPDSPNPFPFPKLRYGNKYQFRARAADLAGNGPPLSSSDTSTASEQFTHYRYEPVPPPTIAGTAPFSVAESTLLLVLLNDLVNPVVPNGRWLFPPRAAQRLCEEHGMFDGFVLGSPPNPADAPNGDMATWTAIANAEPQRIINIPGVKYDRKDKGDTPYFDSSLVLTTPWLPDPISGGTAIVGLPDGSGGTENALDDWSGGPWPGANPVLLLVQNGTSASTSFTPATDAASSTQLVTLPPAGVSVLWISSTLADGASKTLGVYDWIYSVLAANGASDTVLRDFDLQALAGRVWQLTPFRVLRIVHAVRTPLVGPQLRNPYTTRDIGQNYFDLHDDNFLVDEKSTSALDFHAVWTDPYDNPADPLSDPGILVRAYKTSSGPAFRLAVADPTPIGPESQPLTIVAPVVPFAFGPENSFGPDTGSTHHIGDTLHHLVYYTATGTSRYAEMFETSVTAVFHGLTPVKISKLGINPGTVVVTIAPSDTEVVPPKDYLIHADTGEMIYKQSTHSQRKLNIRFQPTTTRAGPAVPVQVLASARPAAPHVSRIIPAWEWNGPVGRVETGIEYDRTGGYLRVYLERPWWSSGANEMLGVVTPVEPLASALTTYEQYPLITMMALDPITYNSTRNRPWPPVPTAFGNLGEVPVVPGRPLYSSPPQVNLVEDTSGALYNIWPYEVHFDSVSNTWFADVQLLPGQTGGETILPPPGYFVRLALVRFQPYSLETLEVSPVTTATIAQPVPNRYVTVLLNPFDVDKASVYVSVFGPGYHGWRPPTNSIAAPHQDDGSNPDSPQIYDAGTLGKIHSSTMVVDVQVQDTSLGFEGELSWKTVTKPTTLQLTTSDTTTLVEWGGIAQYPHLQYGVVPLPYQVGGPTHMRLRISEIDFHGGGHLDTVDTSLRRPFIALIPIN
ncbi:MAG: hypothetical protein ACLPQS_06485 [Acidimicrobiales bacterium]